MTELLVLEFLQAIERGDITIERLGKDSRFYDDVAFFFGDVSYCASNGWLLTVFFDCGCWDFITEIESDTGEKMKYCLDSVVFNNYRPKIAVRRDVYGEPVELYEVREE